MQINIEKENTDKWTDRQKRRKLLADEKKRKTMMKENEKEEKGLTTTTPASWVGRQSSKWTEDFFFTMSRTKPLVEKNCQDC